MSDLLDDDTIKKLHRMMEERMTCALLLGTPNTVSDSTGELTMEAIFKARDMIKKMPSYPFLKALGNGLYVNPESVKTLVDEISKTLLFPMTDRIIGSPVEPPDFIVQGVIIRPREYVPRNRAIMFNDGKVVEVFLAEEGGDK